jgi:Tfp pilus assembly major pilin PilA
MSDTVGASSAPANWYPDPADARLLRYWDGARWTEHTSPAPGNGAGGFPPQQRQGGTNAAIWIVLGSVGLLVIIGIVAAIAIPVFLSQRAKAEDTSAKADVATLGKEIATWFVDHEGNPPVVETAGGTYYVGGLPVATVSNNVILGGQTGSGATDWCVWVRNPEGDLKDYRYSAAEGLDSGTC